MLTKVPVINKKGREKLGKVLKFHREALGLSMDKFVAEIEKTTGRSVSKAAISDLERGNTEPKWDTLAILAASGFFPYTVEELFAIATEKLEIDF